MKGKLKARRVVLGKWELPEKEVKFLDVTLYLADRAVWGPYHVVRGLVRGKRVRLVCEVMG